MILVVPLVLLVRAILLVPLAPVVSKVVRVVMHSMWWKQMWCVNGGTGSYWVDVVGDEVGVMSAEIKSMTLLCMSCA